MDGVILVLVLAFGLRGLFRGLIRQLAALLGLAAALLVAGWVSHGVGIRWHDIQPVLANWALRWGVVVVSALAVAALITWLGDVMGSVVQSTPLAWIDRPAGFVLGASLGLTLATVMTLVALLTPWPPVARHAAARSVLAPPLMAGSAWVCSLGAGWVPGSAWLERQFLDALQRTGAGGRVV